MSEATATGGTAASTGAPMVNVVSSVAGGGGTSQTTEGGQSTSHAGATQTDWASTLPELDRGYIQNKGWRGVSDLLDSYKSIETFRGVPETQLLKLPQDLSKADEKEMGKIYDRLGRPSKPEEYGIKDAAGGTGDFQKWASGLFYEAGLTKRQADAIVSKWNDYSKQAEEHSTAQFNQKIEQEAEGLKKEWGKAYDQSVKEAQMAAREFGIGKDELDALEQTIGYGKVMKFFQKVGAKMGESGFVSAGRQGSGALTPEAAKAQIHALGKDTEFVNRLAAGETNAKSEIDRLTRFAYPEYDE